MMHRIQHVALGALLALAAEAHAGNAPLVRYEGNAGFDTQKDMLCFENYNFDTGPVIFKQVANKFGACQGMIAVAQAFKTNAVFECAGKKPWNGAAPGMIEKVMDAQATGCDTRVRIPGYCSLREYCEANKSAFESASVQYNADLTFRDTVPHFLQLRRGANTDAQTENAQTISQVYAALSQGRPAMMLYPYHVVMVTSMSMTKNELGWLAGFTIYNPSHNAAQESYTLQLDASMQKTIKEPPIFEVTPVVNTSRGCSLDERHRPAF